MRLFLDEFSSRKKCNIKSINFRDKSTGWKSYSISIKYILRKKPVLFREAAARNLYFRGFLQNLYLRPSCHECKFKNASSFSDITIGDYWNIQSLTNEYDDNKGVSLVIVRSLKGSSLLKQNLNELHLTQSTYQHALSGNPCLEKSSKAHPNRKRFFLKLETLPISLLIIDSIKSTHKDFMLFFIEICRFLFMRR